MKTFVSYVFSLSVLLLTLALLASAESTSCDFNTVIVPDGRIRYSTIPASTTYYLSFYSTSGHSYSIELTPDLESYGNLPVAIQVQDVNTLCALPTTLPLNDTKTIDPVLDANDNFGTGFRQTLTVTNKIGNGFISIVVQNTDTNPHTYSFSVTDTTMYSPRWSTWSGFYTSYGLTNTTNGAIAVNLKFVTTSGSTAATFSSTIAAGQNVFVDTRVLSVGANQAGQAILMHNGPPGAILADGFIQNPNTGTIQPVKFDTVRATH